MNNILGRPVCDGKMTDCADRPLTRGDVLELVSETGLALCAQEVKDGLRAALLWSVCCPGAAHVVLLGRTERGLAWFAARALGYLLLILPGVALHVLCARDAARLTREQWLDLAARIADGTKSRSR